MFDEVVVAVGVNIDKRGFFPNEKRIDIIRQATVGLEGVSVIQYDNLTIDKCRELGINHIVRGVRNMIDFETERSIADANRKLAPDIETIIIPTAQEFAHISSTAVRDLLKHGGDTSLSYQKESNCNDLQVRNMLYIVLAADDFGGRGLVCTGIGFASQSRVD